MTNTSLYVQQPSIPAYRVPFFNALQRQEGIDLTLLASHHSIAFGSGRTSKLTSPNHFRCLYANSNHALGGRVAWQSIDDWDVEFDDRSVLVLCSNIRMLSNIRLAWRAKRKGAKIVSWSHVDSATSRPALAFLRRKWNRFLYDHHFVYTEHEVPKLIQEGFTRSTITPLNNCLSPQGTLDYLDSINFREDLANSPTARVCEARKHLPIQVREQLNHHDLVQDHYFIFCSRLTRKTQLPLLLSALASIGDKLDRNFKLVVVGDGEILSECESKSRELDINDRVLWLGEIRDPQKLTPLFLGARFLAYPGAIGLTICHAFQHGLPVLTHDQRRSHGPEFSYLTPGKNGQLFSCNSTESLANQLFACARMETDELSKCAARAAYEEYSFDKMVANFANTVRTLNKGTPSPNSDATGVHSSA